MSNSEARGGAQRAARAAPFRPTNMPLATVGLSLATFMQVLDTTIANVSLPTIAGNLGVSSDQSAWIITSFAVSNAIMLPLTGWLSRRFGEVRLFLAATALFTIASLLCGIAVSMPMLLACRVLQGAVAGPMYPITQSLLVSLYPPEKRSQALALLAMVTVVAPVLGPSLGGWITDSYSWRWIFFINIPIGLFSVVVVASQLAKRPENLVRTRVDYVGLAMLVLGVGALQILLDKGNDLDWFDSTLIVGLAIVAAIALAVFLIWELTDEHPIVDLRLLRHRNFAVGTAVLTFGYGAFFGVSLLVPLWLQTQLGYTSYWAGLAAAPVGLLPILLSRSVGRYAQRFDLRVLASLSFGTMAACSFWRANFTSEVDFYHVALVQFVQGAGVALWFAPLLTIMLSDLRPSEIAEGSGLATFLRTLAGSFSASLTTFIWSRRAEQHHAQLVEHITPYSELTRQSLETLAQNDLQRGAVTLNRIVDAQAYMLSTVEYFTLIGWVFCALVLLLWVARPPFSAKAERASAAAH